MHGLQDQLPSSSNNVNSNNHDNDDKSIDNIALMYLASHGHNGKDDNNNSATNMIHT